MREGDPALSVRRVSVSLAGRAILHDVDFELGAGEFCGLIGANGSGKTTLLRTVLGFVAPSRGTVAIGGAIGGTIGGRPGRARVGYVPQKFALDAFMPLRARDLVQLGLDGNRLGLPLPSAARRRRVDAMLDAVEGMAFADQRVGNLSGGQQQRLLIAHALIRQPRLLLLDEPLANLDMRSAAGIIALLRRLAREYETAVLLSAHDMNPLLPAIDRVVYLAAGRAASGRADEVVRTEVLSRLYGYHIDVLRVHGRVLVVAADGTAGAGDQGIGPEIGQEIGQEAPHAVFVP